MSVETLEIVRLCEALPDQQRDEVANFARFLLARKGDEAWERIIGDPNPRPRLDAFLKESAAEDEEPLDLGRL